MSAEKANSGQPLPGSGRQVTVVRRMTAWGLVANLLLAGAKLLVGVLTGSQACTADAVHSLSDMATDLAVLVGVQFWSAPADDFHPHGHQRIETLIVCIIGLALGGAGIGIAWHAIATMAAGEGTPAGTPVLIIAIISIGIKELLYRWTAAVGTNLHSAALVANAWHHRSDALSSIPVAASAIIGKLIPQLGFVDLMAAVVVALMLFKAAYKIVWPALLELSDAAAEKTVQRQILTMARSVPGVRDVHGLRTRRMGPGYQVDLHVLVDRQLSVETGHGICAEVKHLLVNDGPHIIDVLVHLEPYPTSP